MEGSEERIKWAIDKMGKGRSRGGKGGLWDEECREEKRVVRKELRRWRREGGGNIGSVRGDMGGLCEEKKKEEVVRWEKELEGVRAEGQVWKVLNRERKRRKTVDERIKMVEWEEHFKGMLGGVEWRVRRGGRGERREDGEEEIGREELEGRRVIRRLKEGKAGGGDGIQNEVWKLGGADVEEWLWKLCNKVWKGEG